MLLKQNLGLKLEPKLAYFAGSEAEVGKYSIIFFESGLKLQNNFLPTSLLQAEEKKNEGGGW